MKLPDLKIGKKNILRERFVTGHPYARLGYQASSRVDLPAGSEATNVLTQGSTYLVEVKPKSSQRNAATVQIWVEQHMMPVLFAGK
jgi:hypothetical protein